VYSDEEALRVHQESAYLGAFLAARTPLLAGHRAERLGVTAAKGLNL
jgi:quinol monooxygenase YgiN